MLRYLGLTLNWKVPQHSLRGSFQLFIFKKVATLLEWIVDNEIRRWHLSLYLDNFLLGTCEEDMQNFIHESTDIMQQTGMPVAEQKTIPPAQQLVYLGLLLNLLRQVLAIPDRKRTHYIELIDTVINAFRKRKTVLIRTVQQLAGHLNFICQAIPAGRTFLSGLYAMTASGSLKMVRPGHHRQVNRETCDDMVLFQFLGRPQGTQFLS